MYQIKTGIMRGLTIVYACFVFIFELDIQFIISFCSWFYTGIQIYSSLSIFILLHTPSYSQSLSWELCCCQSTIPSQCWLLVPLSPPSCLSPTSQMRYPKYLLGSTRNSRWSKNKNSNKFGEMCPLHIHILKTQEYCIKKTACF